MPSPGQFLFLINLLGLGNRIIFPYGLQVTNLAWSVTSDELVSTHGYGAFTVPGVVTVWVRS
jgi:hypothetical protein